MNEDDKKPSSHFNRFWWVYVIAAIFFINFIVKGNFRDAVMNECLQKGLGNCLCLADEVTRRHGPIYLDLPLTGERSDGRQIGQSAARYCAIGQ